CHCTPERIERYRGRISGPLLDRIDLHLQVAPVERDLLLARNEAGESSAAIRERVVAARALAEARGHGCNANLGAGDSDDRCPLVNNAKSLLEQAMTRLHLSARAYHRVLRVARCIADLAASEVINAQHVAEAVGYRQFDRGGN